MAGRYVLETGKIEPNIESLNKVYKFPEVRELIKAKRMGEEEAFVKNLNSGKLEELVSLCYQKIDAAYIKSNLPETPTKKDENKLNSFLIKLRRSFI